MARTYTVNLRHFPRRFTAGGRVGSTHPNHHAFTVTAWHRFSLATFNGIPIDGTYKLYIHNGDYTGTYTITAVSGNTVTVSEEITHAGTDYKGYIYHDEDLSDYVAPDFASAAMIAETSLYSFEAGDMSFRVIDKGTTLATRTWADYILKSCHDPEVWVYETLTDLSVPPLFYGFVSRELAQIHEPDVAFTASSMLNQAGKVNYNEDLHGTDADDLYSGFADTLARRALLKVKNTAPGAYADVVIDDQYLPDLGFTADWNWAKRQWKQTDPETDNGISDIVPCVGVSGVHGFFCRNGKLFRLAVGDRSAITPTEISGLKVRMTMWRGATRTSATRLTVASSGSGFDGRMPFNFRFVGLKAGDYINLAGTDYEIAEIISENVLDITGTLPATVNNGYAWKYLSGSATEANDAADAYRLFPFTGYSGAADTACLAIVRSATRSSYSKQVKRWGGITKDAVGIGGAAIAAKLLPIALGVTGNIAPALVAVGASMAVSGAVEGVASATQTSQAIANSDSFQVIRYISIMSIGDGTNDPATGIGGAINLTVWPENGDNSLDLGYAPSDHDQHIANPYIWTFADSVCTSAGNATGNWKGELWWVRWDSSTGTSKVIRAIYGTSGWVYAWQSCDHDAVYKQEPHGGMAAIGRTDPSKAIMWGVQGGYCLMVSNSSSNYAGAYKPREKALGRFISAVNGTGGVKYSYFTLGNDDDRYIRIVQPQTAALDTPEELTIYGVPDGFKLVAASQPLTISGTPTIPIYYHATTSDNRTALFAGVLEADATILALKVSTDAAYQLPDGMTGDWRGPLYFQDSGANQADNRFVAIAERKTQDYHITDYYVTSNWAVARVHQNFVQSPMTCRDVLVSIAQAFYCYLRLYNPDAPTSADEWKVHSRHSLTPRSAGTIDTDAIGVDPIIDGTESYDGAEAAVMGEKVSQGDTACSNRVFQLSSPFLTPNWARAITKRIYNEYPAMSSTFVRGRRRFRVDMRAFDAETPPGYRNLFERVEVSAFSDITGVSCLLLGVGFDRATFSYAATLLQWDSTGVDWASNEVTAVVTIAAAPTQETGAEPTGVTSTRRVLGWEIHPHVSLDPVSNPDDGPCAFWWTVWLDHPAYLKGYLYGMTRNGVGTGAYADGNLFFAVWRDFGNKPYSRIDDAMAYAAGSTPGVPSLDGVLQGANVQALNGPNEADSVYLPRGKYWVYCSIDRDDDATSGGVPCPVTAPPIETWQVTIDGQYCAKRQGFIATDPSYDNNGWLESADYAEAKAAWPTTESVTIPAVYLVLEVA